MSLLELQRAFQRAIHESSEEHLQPYLTPHSFPNVYVQGYHQRLLQVLQKDYPVFYGLLHDRAVHWFEAYIRAFPPRNIHLNFFVESFSDYFAQAASNMVSEVVWIDMVCLEATLCRSVCALYHKPLTLAMLEQHTKESWSSLRVGVNPHVQTLLTRSHAYELWSAYYAEPNLALERFVGEACDPRQFLIWRHGQDVSLRPMNRADVIFYEVFRQNLFFEEACAELDAHFEQEGCESDFFPLLNEAIRLGHLYVL